MRKKGTKNGHIFFNESTHRWTLQSYRYPGIFLTTVTKMKFGLPLGSHLWKLEADNALCGNKAGHIQRLTFSDCFPGKYTCNNGDCIPLR